MREQRVWVAVVCTQATAWATLLLVAAAFATPVTAADPSAKPRTTLLVPAYFYPAGDGLQHWDDLLAAADRVPIVAIVNPASGPGKAADPKKAGRTIRVDMGDTMRYTPAEITVKRGETVRFVARNVGKVMHEMVLGTKEELARHAEQMRKHPGMEHDEPHMLHVAPGRTG